MSVIVTTFSYPVTAQTYRSYIINFSSAYNLLLVIIPI